MLRYHTRTSDKIEKWWSRARARKSNLNRLTMSWIISKRLSRRTDGDHYNSSGFVSSLLVSLSSRKTEVKKLTSSFVAYTKRLRIRKSRRKVQHAESVMQMEAKRWARKWMKRVCEEICVWKRERESGNEIRVCVCVYQKRERCRMPGCCGSIERSCVIVAFYTENR